MVVPVIMLAIGFVLLIKGGDWFVDGASGIARRFRLPEILIGATVVSIGTTLPEVMVSAGAAFQGGGSIAYGNAIGSLQVQHAGDNEGLPTNEALEAYIKQKKDIYYFILVQKNKILHKKPKNKN